MEEGEQPDDFDDFFDSPGRSVDDTAISAVKSEQNRDSKSAVNRSGKKHNRNNSATSSVDRSVRRSVTSDHDASPDYSSDSVTDSDSDTDSGHRKRRKERSRSRSASSRSGGSVSSESSYSSVESRESQSRSSRKNGRRSRSRSESTDSSRSRTASPDSTTRKRKTEARGKRRDSYSSVTSSSTYSGEKGKGRRSPSPKPKPAPRRQAWDSEENFPSRRQQRPQTAKRRSSDDKPARQKESHRKEYSRKSYADTDSDMTDVSPIASPRNGSVNGHDKELGDKSLSTKSKPAMYQAMPLGVEDSGTSNVQEPDANAIDLNILMKAVSELEKQKRVKSNTRRVMFEPLRARPMEKSNYTFNNDDTHRIEQENKRLLRQIMQQVRASGGKQLPVKDAKVKQATLTTSAINRRREQQRIENENLAFLRRLQKIKPSRGLSRNEQLASYNSTVLHGIPIATLHPADSGTRSGRHSSASSVAGSLGRTRSLTSVHSAATASSFGTTASRQSSRAGSRPTSAKKSGRERPPWNDRW